MLHGNRTYVLCDDDGQIIETHSVSAGLDYPGIGPEHSWLKDVGRIEVTAIRDDEALEAFSLCARLEGILPALECSHALAEVAKQAPRMAKDRILVERGSSAHAINEGTPRRGRVRSRSECQHRACRVRRQQRLRHQ